MPFSRRQARLAVREVGLEAGPLRLSAATIPADNRRLVEAATHPAVLADLAAQRGDPWPAHQNHVLGALSAAVRVANLNLVRRDLSFEDPCLVFPSDRRIPTRLGEDDRLARLPTPPPRSPLGAEVTEVRIPGFWLRGAAVPADLDEATHLETIPGGFTFHYGPVACRYDRWGLQRQEG